MRKRMRDRDMERDRGRERDKDRDRDVKTEKDTEEQKEKALLPFITAFSYCFLFSRALAKYLTKSNAQIQL